jgi:hypothetical protein
VAERKEKVGDSKRNSYRISSSAQINDLDIFVACIIWCEQHILESPLRCLQNLPFSCPRLIDERDKAGSVTHNHRMVTFSAFFADDAPNHRHLTCCATKLLSVDKTTSFSVQSCFLLTILRPFLFKNPCRVAVTQK